MVDPETVAERLARLGALIALLEQVQSRGINVYRGDDDLRAATERRLQLAIQICIDVGAHLLSETNARPPGDYADIFTSLAEVGSLDRGLAMRMAQSARQRNLLVHSYLQIDDAKVFQSLGHLDDLRAFAAAIQRIVDADG